MVGSGEVVLGGKKMTLTLGWATFSTLGWPGAFDTLRMNRDSWIRACQPISMTGCRKADVIGDRGEADNISGSIVRNQLVLSERGERERERPVQESQVQRVAVPSVSSKCQFKPGA